MAPHGAPYEGSASEMTYIVSSGALNSTHSLTPMRGALTPFTVCDAYRYFAGRALLMTSQK